MHDEIEPPRADRRAAPERPPPEPWAPPDEFGDYRVVEPLGHGAFVAVDRVLERRVSVRFLTRAPVDEDARRRIFAELRDAVRLQHPNVAAVHGAGHLEGRPYVVSEHVPGETLDQVARPITWRRARDIGVGLARGLAAAHRKGILHGALAPSNLILAEDGNPKLLELGHAREREDDGGEDVPYRAPELWRGDPPSRRGDVYALGAVLYELCAGTPPHGEIPEGRLRRIVNEREVRPLAQVIPEVNARLAQIVNRCLRREPRERFASGEELSSALEQLGRLAEHAAPTEGNPYRGLRPFEAEHRAFFFGRDAEVEALMGRLRSETLVLVAGDSGVGKSSICRAGILPRVAAGGLGDGRAWSVVHMVPGRHPLAALATALAGALRRAPEDLARELREDPASIATEVRRGLGGAEGLLLLVDQLEELHTNSDRDEAERVDDLLMRLAGGVAGVRVVATVRADFLTRVAMLPRLGEEMTRALYLLRPLTPEKIREVVVGPVEGAHARFEDEAMVDELVESTASAGGALPLLQFALALLWEARDVERGVVTRASLEQLGGVSGALARHADAVVDGFSVSHRVAARHVMTRLVTLENARARRTGDDLTCGDAIAAEALDALVRGRLVVACEAAEGGAFELAHEVLVHGWGTLAGWLREDETRRQTRERLARAAAEWTRLYRRREGLWGARQLAEIGDVEAGGLTPREREFLAASRRALLQRGRRRWLVAAMVPLVAATAWGAVEWKVSRDLGRRVDLRLDEARGAIARAGVEAAERARLRRTTFELFDSHDREGGEVSWARALGAEARLAREQAIAGQALEAALVLDPRRPDVRDMFGDVLYDRAALADEQRQVAQRDELISRVALYDGDGSRLRRWHAPAALSITTAPRSAPVVLHRYEEREGRRLVAGPPLALAESPASAPSLEPGSYLLVVDAPGRVPVRLPILLARGETVSLDVTLPAVSAVPPSFVYVPEGRFLFGSTADEDLRIGFFDAAPIHEVRTGAYLIARDELTYQAWIDYLHALTPEERARHLPRAGANVGGTGSMRLEELPDGAFRLHLQPGSEPLSARSDERLRYPARSRRAEQSWLRFPVTGISGEDVGAYAAWLRATGRVPGARLCTEIEWERAARGADDREFPHGNELLPDDADFDLTYGKSATAMGPDETGSHPASRSPFELDDMAGNAFEWTSASLAPGQYVVRGGAFFYDKKTARTSNRQVTVPSLRDATVGARICADAGEP